MPAHYELLRRQTACGRDNRRRLRLLMAISLLLSFALSVSDLPTAHAAPPVAEPGGKKKQPRPVINLKKRVLREGKDRFFGRAAVEALPDGTWLLVYREAEHHARNRDGRLHIMVSKDRGKTWSREDRHLDGRRIKQFPAWPPGAGPGQPAGPGEPWLYRAPDGTLILHCWKVKYSDRSHNGGTWQMTSSDNGRTWSKWSQVDFQGIADDDNVFATDDHFIHEGTIYAGARQFAGGKWKNLLIQSADNGRTWRKMSDISSYRHNTSEVGLEYLGGKRILAVLNTKNRRAVYRTFSDDLGRTWQKPEAIHRQTQIWDRCRIWNRSHLQGKTKWWTDPVILGVGDQALVPGQSMPRRNALWLSRDGGKTWSGPVGLDDRTQDAGYGDMLYDAATGTYRFFSYHGTMEEARLVEYRFKLRE